MNEEQNVQAQAPATQPQEAIDVEKIVKELQGQGLDAEKILQAIAEMAKEGKLSPEDVEKAKQILSQPADNEAEEQQQAEKMFGMKFIQ